MTIVAIDFGGTNIKVGLLDGPRILVTRAFATVGSALDLENVGTAVDEMLRELNASPEGDLSIITGVGIAMPGIVNQREGALIAAHDKYRYAVGMDIGAWAEGRFGVPAVIENDARAALAGEARYGCAVGERNVVLIILGTGIGTAALINGELFRGAHDHGGILGGHITVDLDGPMCNCGNVGCAEAIASAWALERILRQHPQLAESSWPPRLLGGGSAELKDLVASRDDPVSHEILSRFIRAWGAAAIGLCHAYDPDVVIVSGGVMRSASVILPPLTTYIHDHLWSSSYRPRVITPNAPEHSVLLGLSAMCSEGGEPAGDQGTAIREGTN